jgi:mannose-1-phosphate guanylyltransferase
VIFDGATIAADAHVTRSIVGTDASIGQGSHVVETVIADRAKVGARNELLSGARVFPDSIIPDGTIRFSSDRS